MWLYKSKFLRWELQVVVFCLVYIFGIIPYVAVSQEITHSFKITGKTRIPVYSGEAQERSVEYDPARTDHLTITSYRKNGYILGKTQFLFKGKKFNLLDIREYINQKTLLKDGNETIYSEKESPQSELIFRADTLQQQTFFYPDGKRQTSFQGNATTLNGEFKMWYPDGKLSFLGTYKNSLKDGQFESFDAAGNTDRKGIYEQGKLISGQSVVQDLLYDKPDIAPQPIVGERSLNDYLKVKTAGLTIIKQMAGGIIRNIDLKLTIDKSGHINKWEIVSPAIHSDIEIMEALIKEFPEFKPALLEGAPVSSIFKMELSLSNQGLEQRVHKEDEVYTAENDSIEQMPEFPGGEMAKRKFLSNTVRYPMEAAVNGIMGKVYVNFIVEKDGTISNAFAINKVDLFLDAEAVRVIRSMPKWIPGLRKGKPVKVSYTVPINFVIK